MKYCPKCKMEFDDDTKVCPYCEGELTAQESKQELDSVKSKKRPPSLIWLAVVLCVACVVFYPILSSKSSKKNDSDSSSDTFSPTASSIANGNIMSVSFDEAFIVLGVGDKKTLNINAEPNDVEEGTFTLTSEDPTIAIVNVDGQVIGISPGITTVTIALKDNENISASIIVNVTGDKAAHAREFASDQ